MRGWPIEIFEHIRLCKFMDYFIDPSELLTDKAILPSRENWIYEFDAQAYASYHGKFPGRPFRTHDRVLLKYLQEDEVPVKEIIDNVSQLKLDHQDMAMVVVFKEKELKSDKARGFCKLTYNMRLWQVATEKNLGDPGIFFYIKYQLMTMSEQEQTHY